MLRTTLIITLLNLCGLLHPVSAAMEIQIENAVELQSFFAIPRTDVTVQLAPGVYSLAPQGAVDSSCGNCENPDRSISITVGLHLRGSGVVLRGPADRSAIIHTDSGYGIFFEQCDSCQLVDLQITGGARDSDPNATSAAVVVKQGKVIIERCLIRDNIGDSALVVANVVGIIGIAGREGADLTIVGNEILRNSWDGIALYRGARALIEHNLIDGVDQAGGSQAGGGRGVAIGVTWDAQAVVTGNLARRYWKGIGFFVDARGVIRENIVEEMLTWGISLWDADSGLPAAEISDNIIFHTGACGAAITLQQPQSQPGCFTGNLLLETAQDSRYDSPDYYCDQCALALQAVPDNFIIRDNRFFHNRRATPELPDRDEVDTLLLPLLEHYRVTLAGDTLQRRSAFYDYLMELTSSR